MQKTINNDYFNQGLCAISLCEVYGKCYDSVRKTTYAKVAIDAFEKANKTDWELYAKLYLAGALITNQAFDSAMIVLKEIVSDPIAQKDPVLLSGAYDHAALTMLGAENDTMAIKYYAKAISLDENNLSDGAAQNIYALLSLNNPRISDDKDFQILIDYLRRIKPEKPFGILALEGKYKEAYDAIEVYRTEQDEFIRGIMNRSIDSTIENYHKHKNEVMAQQLKLEQKNKIIYISVFLIILIIIGLIIKHKLRKQRIRQDEIIEEAKFLSASLGNMNHKNTLLLESIRELLSKQFSIVDTICSQYYESNDKKSIAKELDKLIKDFTEDTQIINEIENDINRHYENLMTNLRAEVPTLTDNDCRLFIFAFQGFTTSSIALLLGETSKEAVYTRKSRLKTKIRKSASTNKEYYISLIK